MGLFAHWGSTPEPAPERLLEQTVKPAAIEDDNGVITTTYSSIQNSLYDLADRRSKTNAIVLPSGTKITLASVPNPSVSSFAATFEVIPKKGKPQTVIGSGAAAELAFKLDVLGLSAEQKRALQGLNEAEQHAKAREHLPRVTEKEIHVSSYVTRSGRHVGAYSQVRDILKKLESGDTAHFPEGIKVTRGKSSRGGTGLIVHSPSGGSSFHADAYGQPEDTAAQGVIADSARSTHAKSLGGATSMSPTEFRKQHGDETPQGKAVSGSVFSEHRMSGPRERGGHRVKSGVRPTEQGAKREAERRGETARAKAETSLVRDLKNERLGKTIHMGNGISIKIGDGAEGGGRSYILTGGGGPRMEYANAGMAASQARKRITSVAQRAAKQQREAEKRLTESAGFFGHH